MADIPCILTHVDYDGQTTISVVLSSEHRFPGFLIGLFKTGDLIKSSPFQTQYSGSLTTDAPLTGASYRVAATTSDGPGDVHSWGNRIGVVTAEATGVAARCDLRSVTVSWTMQATPHCP